MFTIALAILIPMLFVAIVLFVWRPPRYWQRIPTSLASQMAYVASSSLMEDLREMDQSLRPEEMETVLKKKSYRYGYGRFVGLDHKPHVEIARVPHHTPLEGQVKRRTGSRFSVGRNAEL